jgi:hypothetical protein
LKKFLTFNINIVKIKKIEKLYIFIDWKKLINYKSMGCDYTQETCFEISWINPETKLLKIDYYVLDDQTKYKYFQNDTDQEDILAQELEIKFQPICIVSNSLFNQLDNLCQFLEISEHLNNEHQIYCWAKKYILDWEHQNVLLEDIINGTYLKSFIHKKITQIKLIKRNQYLGKYYY